MGQDAIHDLTAAYALDALDEHEEAEYEAHLSACPACRDELASFQETAVAFASAVEAPAPSPALRARILTQARDERSNVVPFPERRWTVPIAAAGAAAASVAVGLGLWAASLSSSLDEERQAREQRERALAVVADPDARSFRVSGADGTLLVTAEGEAALVLQEFEAAPEGKIYEAWVTRDGTEMLPAGTFTAQQRGTTVVPLSRPVPAGGLVAVTLEDGPVERPTSEPLLTADTA